MLKESTVKDILLGLSTGDALGVPVEFKKRSEIKLSPVMDMVGYGTYNLPPGTWSDDSSMAFCLAESLIDGYSIDDIAGIFVDWAYKNYWTPYGKLFDIGMATRRALERVHNGVSPLISGGFEDKDNGNGSLMRILPIVLYGHDKPTKERYNIIKEVSGITHGHIRSIIACFYYTEYALLIMDGMDKYSAYLHLKKVIPEFLFGLGINPMEIAQFDRLLKDDIYKLSEDRIFSSGYVVHTLEASMWCLLTTNNYPDAVLKAVNLGDDTDTTGAVVGGIAGLLYGHGSIPEKWVSQLARYDDIIRLCGY